MRIGFLRTCFGCCSLRTGVLLCAIVDLIIGIYDITEFCIRIYLEFHHRSTNISIHNTRSNRNNTINATIQNTTATVPTLPTHGELYGDSAFAVIVFGCVDILISSFLIYVTFYRKYDLRVVVFIAAIWSFVFAFLDVVSFAIFIAQNMWVEVLAFLVHAVLEILFGYVILSYFKFMTVVVERGLAEVQMSYFPEETVTEIHSEVQTCDGNDERPIMDDQDDFNCDDEQSLVVT